MTVYDFDFTEPFANGADSSEIQPFPDENRGLGIAFVQTDGKPEMKGLNGLFNKISKALLSIRQNGVLGWVNNLEYKQGGFVVEANLLYQAKRNNTNKRPSLSQDDWELWTNASNIAVDANGNITKTVATNGAITLKVDDAAVSRKGVVPFANASQVTNKVTELVAITPRNAANIAESTDIGVGQTVRNLTGSRSLGVVYKNETGKPIFLSVYAAGASGNPLVLIVDGVTFVETRQSATVQSVAIIPNGSTYIMYGSSLQSWVELRGN